MECELCHHNYPSLINLRIYTPRGISVCSGCYLEVDANRHRPYSKVMDRLAIAEAGYYANRKIAKLSR